MQPIKSKALSGSLLRSGTNIGICRNLMDISTKLGPNKTFDNSHVTHPAFSHPVEDKENLEKIGYDHRIPVTFGDRVANGSVKFFRWCFDLATGYKHPNTGVDARGTYWEMTESKWLTRCIFLESVAGIPGMTAAFLRHLHSLRLLKRDRAWIETLLDEAYNERIHFLTFINLGQPSWFTRVFIFLGQGVFCNIFFFNYLFFPKFCHRFVGYLEEEAVSTYSHFVKELDSGRLKKFDNVKVPAVARQYWSDLNENSTIRDLVVYIRADEAKHREVNHTFANLDQKKDRNPYALQLGENQPRNDLKTHHPTGWEKKDIIM